MHAYNALKLGAGKWFWKMSYDIFQKSFQYSTNTCTNTCIGGQVQHTILVCLRKISYDIFHSNSNRTPPSKMLEIGDRLLTQQELSDDNFLNYFWVHCIIQCFLSWTSVSVTGMCHRPRRTVSLSHCTTDERTQRTVVPVQFCQIRTNQYV